MRMQRNWNTCALFAGIQSGAAAMKNGLAAPQKI